MSIYHVSCNHKLSGQIYICYKTVSQISNTFIVISWFEKQIMHIETLFDDTYFVFH